MANYSLAKQILQRSHPTEVLRPQPATDWQGEFPLPEAVAEYFTDFGPVDVTIEGYGNPFFLPSVARLWEHQDGYRYEKRLPVNKRLDEWDDDWLVIADEAADPFIFSRSKGTILFASHGEGVWEPEEIFESLVEMATSFAILGEIVVSAGSSMLEKHRAEARERIAEFTKSQSRADEIISNMGWGED